MNIKQIVMFILILLSFAGAQEKPAKMRSEFRQQALEAMDLQTIVSKQITTSDEIYIPLKASVDVAVSKLNRSVTNESERNVAGLVSISSNVLAVCRIKERLHGTGSECIAKLFSEQQAKVAKFLENKVY